MRAMMILIFTFLVLAALMAPQLAHKAFGTLAPAIDPEASSSVASPGEGLVFRGVSMPQARRFPILFTCILTITLALAATPAQAGIPEALLSLHNKIMAVGDAVTRDTVTESLAKCQALGDEFKKVQDTTPQQQAYAEAQVEACNAIVLHDGNAPSSAGSACGHYFTYAQKMAALAGSMAQTPGSDVDFVAEVILQLERASEKSKYLDCKDDYAVFAPALAALKKAAEHVPNLDFMHEIQAFTAAVTPGNAKDSVAKCNDFGNRMVDMHDLSDVESNYYIALIEGCLAAAAEKGNLTDESGGTACSHIFGYAQNLNEAIKVAKDRPGAFQAMVPDMQASLKKAVAHSAELKCAEDLSELK
jgi:hypothetical protein